jgi:hypothetical protein
VEEQERGAKEFEPVIEMKGGERRRRRCEGGGEMGKRKADVFCIEKSDRTEQDCFVPLNWHLL